jgi:hypothetical protein
MKKYVVSLCDYSGVWSKPYLDNGYNVVCADIKRGIDIFDFENWCDDLAGDTYCVLIAPPCTHFTKASARYWKKYDLAGDTYKSIEIVRCCLRIVAKLKPDIWALENPAGRIVKLIPELGKPAYKFNPFDYGHNVSKLTYLWGDFVVPMPLYVGSYTVKDLACWVNSVPQSKIRAEIRSRTFEGFSKSFYMANNGGI